MVTKFHEEGAIFGGCPGHSKALAIFDAPDIFTYASCFGRHVVGQGIVSILQSHRRCGASSKLSLNLLIQFYLNTLTNLHELTSQSTTMLQRGDRIVTTDYCD